MDRLKEGLRRLDLFDALSAGLIACVFLIALAYWGRFPLFKDIYYHMGTTTAFGEAGGVALFDFWEFAPVGRAHLYPPLLHVIMYTMQSLGLSISTVGRLVSFSAFYLVLISTWYAMKRLYGSRPAFYTLVVLCSVFMFFWQSAVTSAASLVLIIAPLIFVAVERQRKVAACLLLALALYSHLVLGHLVAFGLLIYALHRWRERFKSILLILIGAYLLWLPWGIHIIVNREYLSLGSPMGGSGGMVLHVLVLLAALAGFVYCYFRKKAYYLLPSYLLAMVPIIFFYPNRFWDGHALVPMAMLGGVALSGLHGLVRWGSSRYVKRPSYKALVTAAMAIPVAVFLLVDPVYATNGSPPSQGDGPGLRLQAPAFPYDGSPLAPSPPGGGPPPGIQEPGEVPRGATSSRDHGRTGSTDLSLACADIDSLRYPLGAHSADDESLGPREEPGRRQAPPGALRTGGIAPPGGGGGSSSLQPRSSTLVSLMRGETGRGMHSLGTEPMLNQDTEELARVVEENSEPDQIVSAPDSSLGNLVTALTVRASTGGMFMEVSPAGEEPRIEDAYLVIVQEGSFSRNAGMNEPGATNVRGSELSSLELVGTAGAYSVYVNSSAEARSSVSGTVIPWYVVYPLLFLFIILILVDWFRPFRIPPRRRAYAGAGDEGGGPEIYSSKEMIAIVPAYNEEKSIGKVIDEIAAAAPFLEIAVVDDGSTDATASVAAAHGARVISNPWNMGIGAAVRAGMSYALERGFEIGVRIDGDGQHDPSCVYPLISPVRSGLADAAIGSRFLTGGGYEPPWHRRLGTRLLAWVVSSVTGQRATDTTSGFKAMNRKAMAFLVENYPDDYPESESIVLMHLAGIRWLEVPVTMRDRLNGKSSIGRLASLHYMVKVPGCIALDALRVRVPRSFPVELGAES